MIDFQAMFQNALRLHHAGTPQAAIPIYLQIMKSGASDPYLLFLVGTAYSQLGKHETGIKYLKESAKISPNPITYNNIAGSYTALNRSKEAIDQLKKAIEMDPSYAEGFCNLGAAQREAGLLNDSLASLDHAIRLSPQYRQAFTERGLTLYTLKNYTQSLDAYFAALSIDPSLSETYRYIGDVMIKLDRLTDAIYYYDKSIAIDPMHPEVFSNRAGTLKKLRRFDEALSDYDKAIELNPQYFQVYSNRGNTLKELHRYDEALNSFSRAISLKPDFAEAYSNKGVILSELNEWDEALKNYSKAISIKCDIDWLLGMKLHSQMHTCDWNGLETQTIKLIEAVIQERKATTPFVLLSLCDAPEAQKKASEIYVEEKFPALKRTPPFSRLNGTSKIKLGYFSADFHDHATMHLMAELFEMHDKSLFESIAFSFGPITNDVWQLRAKSAFDQFIECNEKSDAEVAEISRQLCIDIAVDLKGFTQGSRTGIFSERAAPIQVNFIGYPGTMGANLFDYIISDKTIIPEQFQYFYTEKIAYLPGCYQPNCREREISNKKISRNDFGLPEDGIVFCSFNNNYKITPEIFTSWLKILTEVEGSVLWLLASNSTAEQNLIERAVKGGIKPNRIIFAQRLPIHEHLNRIQLADLMLDTFPYGAHTTCSDALRMGLPIVTLTGKSFASRVATSLLRAIGLPELATESITSYENLAINLAKSPKRLSTVSEKLKESMKSSTIFDSNSYTKNLEHLYEVMYKRFKDKLAPDHIE